MRSGCSCGLYLTQTNARRHIKVAKCLGYLALRIETTQTNWAKNYILVFIVLSSFLNRDMF